MAFQIPGIDLNPNAGDSFMGLTREQAKKVANALLIFGFFLALPPFVPDPTDLLNPILAKFLSSKFPISFQAAYPITYLFGIAIMIIGAWIYPYNTHAILNGYINKAKLMLKKAFKSPRNLFILIVIILILYKMYSSLGVQ